ncbi:hypothetical protein P280DRAFT_468412 [Massarina eburnea CBS 473.64]|uniref:F-box domain-containing protein n=1 Tax=Massarina eburnea CBS 473.64 TaxID=1395130 RepID=A0A6A6S2Z5_9PLEO|nr:hypothetical protein P280DRAFT_468412 [Massarina eburnea CBS 473.64]
MGYSEVPCHLCAVTFNIGRIRTPLEPRSAAWSRFGPILANTRLNPENWGYEESYVNGDRSGWIGECHRDSGCMFAIREIKDKGRKYSVDQRGKRRLGEIEETDEGEDADDMDWEQDEESDEDEPLEYTSDESDEADSDVGDAEKSNPRRESFRDFWLRGLLEDNEARKSLASDNSGMPAWYRGFPAHVPLEEQEDVEDDMFQLFYPGRDDTSSHRHTGKSGYRHKDLSEVEHIAGPGCLHLAGYSGHDISVEEMRGCQVLQCLVPKIKNSDFVPQDDDEDFEKEGDFFLSGLGDYMPSRDIDCPRVTPPRHGCRQPHAENHNWGLDFEDPHAMPFHPTCFEVFKRVSLLQNGNIDVSGLMDWWANHASEYDKFRNRVNHPDVKECRMQEWKHWHGTAYLVANPLYVPKLRDILHSATSTATDFHPRNGAFTIPTNEPPETSYDTFNILPIELRFQILDHLSSKDIAALRLTSRTFHQLPISYFQKLILREMPWLWEAWPTANKPERLPPYAFWATVTGVQAEKKLQKTPKAIAILNDYVKIVSKEMPELAPLLENRLPGAIQQVLDEHKRELDEHEDRKPFFLPPGGTDYFLLYTLITRHWGDLKGLQNRRRIWTDCEETLKEMKRVRR